MRETEQWLNQASGPGKAGPTSASAGSPGSRGRGDTTTSGPRSTASPSPLLSVRVGLQDQRPLSVRDITTAKF